MQMRRVVMMVVAGCAVGMLTGCGVPKEEHEAKIAELNSAWAEIETLKGEVADTESLLNSEKGKVRNARIELTDASKRVTELEAKETADAKALAAEKDRVAELENQVAVAQSNVEAADNRTSEVEAARVALQEAYDKLRAEFDQFKRNIRGLGGAPAPEVTIPSPATESNDDSKSALDLLDEMSME